VDTHLRDSFTDRWRRYFGDADLPIAMYYTDHVGAEVVASGEGASRCLICNVADVLAGHTYIYNAKAPGCPGGKRYTGFTEQLRPDFEYFLSCGIPGKMEGERYKQTPDLVRAYLAQHPPFAAPGSSLVFKRWDNLTADETPLAAVFFAAPDVLAGLFTLANYDVEDPYGVVAPMGSGCASIVAYPYAESRSATPRCVLGMFDISARPCVPEDVLTFAVPMARFEQMIRNMDESFLITDTWRGVSSNRRAADT
jgi:hypothetical protein